MDDWSIKSKNSDIDESNIMGMADWRERYASLFRTMAVVLIFAFTLYDITWAQGGEPIKPSVIASPAKQGEAIPFSHDSKQLKIPNDIGITHSSYINGSDKLIINIQDAHSELSAQYSIVKILEDLAKNYDLNLVAAEGAEGPVDLSLLKSFPDKEIRKETADYFMRQGRMSAGEFFALVNEKPIKFYGIEDNALYQENLKALRAFLNDNAVYATSVDEALNILKKLESHIYSDDLKALNDKSILNHDAGAKDPAFTEYWQMLFNMAAKYGLKDSAPLLYPNVNKLLKTIELEKTIDHSKATLERNSLIDSLQKVISKDKLEELALKAVALKEGKISQGEFYSYLMDIAASVILRSEATKNLKDSSGPSGLQNDTYSNLTRFTEYIRLYETIDFVSLFTEIESFESTIREKLFRNNDEKELYCLSRAVKILKQLFSISLTNSDYEFVVKNREYFSDERLNNFIGREAIPIFSHMDEAMRIYTLAQKRNSVMIANTVKAMNQNGEHVAAMITGGYHSKGLSNLMKEKGLSYLIVMPKFKEGEKRPYIAVLTNKKQSYEDVIKDGGKLIAVEVFHQQLTTGDVKEAIVRLCLILRREGIAFDADYRQTIFRNFKKNEKGYSILRTQWSSQGKTPDDIERKEKILEELAAVLGLDKDGNVIRDKNGKLTGMQSAKHNDDVVIELRHVDGTIERILQEPMGKVRGSKYELEKPKKIEVEVASEPNVKAKAKPVVFIPKVEQILTPQEHEVPKVILPQNVEEIKPAIPMEAPVEKIFPAVNAWQTLLTVAIAGTLFFTSFMTSHFLLQALPIFSTLGLYQAFRAYKLTGRLVGRAAWPEESFEDIMDRFGCLAGPSVYLHEVLHRVGIGRIPLVGRILDEVFSFTAQFVTSNPYIFVPMVIVGFMIYIMTGNVTKLHPTAILAKPRNAADAVRGMRNLEKAYTGAILWQRNEIAVHGTWSESAVKEKHEDIIKAIKTDMKTLRVDSVAYSAFKTYMEKIRLMHEEALNILRILYLERPAIVTLRQPSAAEKQTQDIWDRWNLDNTVRTEAVTNIVNAKDRINGIKKEIKRLEEAMAAGRQDTAQLQASIITVAASLDEAEKNLVDGLTRYLVSLVLATEDSFERHLYAAAFLDELADEPLAGLNRADVLKAVIASRLHSGSQTAIAAAASQILKGMQEKRLVERQDMSRMDRYSTSIEGAGIFGRSEIVDALNEDQNAAAIMDRLIGMDLRKMQSVADIQWLLKKVIPVSVMGVLLLLFGSFLSNKLSPPAPFIPTKNSPTAASKVDIKERTIIVAKDSGKITPVYLKGIMSRMRGLSPEAKKPTLQVEEAGRAKKTEEIKKKLDASNSELVANEKALEISRTPPKQLIEQSKRLDNFANGLKHEPDTQADREKRRQAVPEEWNALLPVEALATPGKTQASTEVESDSFLKSGYTLNPGKVTHGGGNESLGSWIADVENGNGYLAIASYPQINPIAGAYSPISPKWQKWDLATAGRPEGAVTMRIGSKREIALLVPPLYIVTSIETERPGVKGTIYFDSANRVWYMKCDGNPGNTIKIGIRKARPDEFENISALKIDDTVKDKYRESFPASIRKLLDSAKNLPQTERIRIKREIMGMFYYTVNSLLGELSSREPDFIKMAFKYKALKCDGFAMMDAILSYELGMPVMIQSGFMNSGFSGTFCLSDLHAWCVTSGGIEEATAFASKTSPLYGKEGVGAATWKEELDLIIARAENKDSQIEAITKLVETERKSAQLRAEMKHLEAEKKQAEKGVGDVRAYYDHLMKQSKKEIRSLNVPKYFATGANNAIEKLINDCEGFIFSDETVSDEYQLMAEGHFLFGVLAEMDGIIGRCIGYARDKDILNIFAGRIANAKVKLYKEIKSYAAKKGWNLLEPAPQNAEALGIDFEPRKNGSTVEDLLKTRENIPVVILGLNGKITEKGTSTDYYVTDTAGEELYPGKVLIQPDDRVINYSQGKLIRKRNILTAHGKKDVYFIDKEQLERGEYYSDLKIFTALNGKWLGIARDLDDNVMFIGPLAKKANADSLNMSSVDYKTLRMLPDGSWVAIVTYKDGAEGYAGTFAEGAFQGEKFAHVMTPFVDSNDDWLGMLHELDGRIRFVGKGIEAFVKEIWECTKGRKVLDCKMIAKGRWIALVTNSNNSQCLVGPLAEEIGVAEKEFKPIVQNDYFEISKNATRASEYLKVFRLSQPLRDRWEVYPQGLVILKSGEFFISAMGRLADEIGIAEGVTYVSIKVDFVPGGALIATARPMGEGIELGYYTVGTGPGMGYKSVSRLRGTYNQRIIGPVILKDNSWIAAVLEAGKGYKLLGPIVEKYGELAKGHYDMAAIAEDGSFCVATRTEDGKGLAFKGPAAERGTLKDEVFESLPWMIFVFPDGRWVAGVSAADRTGVLELKGPLAEIVENKFMRVVFEEGPSVVNSRKLPPYLEVAQTSRGYVMRWDGKDYFIDTGTDYLSHVNGMYSIGNFNEPHLVHSERLDLRFREFNALARAGSSFDMASFIDIMNYMQRKGMLSEGKEMPRYFDCKEALTIIENNMDKCLSYEDLTAANLLKFLRATDEEMFVDALIRLTDKNARRAKEIVQRLGLGPEQVQKAIADYLQFHKNANGVREGQTPYVSAFEVLNLRFDKEGKAVVDPVKDLNDFLGTYTAGSMAKYRNMAAHMDKTLGTLFPGVAGARPASMSIQQALEFIRAAVGMPGRYFDSEFSPRDRHSVPFTLVRLLRMDWEQFKVSYSSFPWSSDWQINREKLRNWKSVNRQLSDILDKSGYVAKSSPVSVRSIFLDELIHDLLGLGFIFGIISFALSYLSDWLRKKEKIFGMSGEDIIDTIWKINPWLKAGKAAKVCELLSEMRSKLAKGERLTEMDKAQLRAARDSMGEGGRAIFDIVRCVALETPRVSKRFYMRALNFIPFISILLVRDIYEYRNRQRMNYELFELVNGIKEGTSVREVYKRLRGILGKYGTVTKIDAVAYSNDESQRRIREMFERYENIKNLDTREIRSFLLRPDGASLRRAGIGDEFWAYEKLTPGDTAPRAEIASAKYGVDVKKTMRQAVTKRLSIFIDMNTLFQEGYADNWLEDYAKSFRVILERNGLHLGKVIFLMPGESVPRDTDCINREALTKGGFAKSMQNVYVLLEQKYSEALEMVMARPAQKYSLRFYDSRQNERYGDQTDGIFAREEYDREKIDRAVSGLGLAGHSVVCVGVENDRRKEITDLFAGNRAQAMFWHGNRIGRYRPEMIAGPAPGAGAIHGKEMSPSDIASIVSEIEKNKKGLTAEQKNKASEALKDLRQKVSLATIDNTIRSQILLQIQRLSDGLENGSIVTYSPNVGIRSPTQFILGCPLPATGQIALIDGFFDDITLAQPAYLEEALLHEILATVTPETSHIDHKARYTGIQRKIFGPSNPMKEAIRSYIMEKPEVPPIVVLLVPENMKADAIEAVNKTGAAKGVSIEVVGVKDEAELENQNLAIKVAQESNAALGMALDRATLQGLLDSEKGKEGKIRVDKGREGSEIGDDKGGALGGLLGLLSRDLVSLTNPKISIDENRLLRQPAVRQPLPRNDEELVTLIKDSLSAIVLLNLANMRLSNIAKQQAGIDMRERVIAEKAVRDCFGLRPRNDGIRQSLFSQKFAVFTVDSEDSYLGEIKYLAEMHRNFMAGRALDPNDPKSYPVKMKIRLTLLHATLDGLNKADILRKLGINDILNEEDLIFMSKEEIRGDRGKEGKIGEEKGEGKGEGRGEGKGEGKGEAKGGEGGTIKMIFEKIARELPQGCRPDQVAIIDKESNITEDMYKDASSQELLKQTSLVLYRGDTIDPKIYYLAIAMSCNPQLPPPGVEEKVKGIRIWVILPPIKPVDIREEETRYHNMAMAAMSV